MTDDANAGSKFGLAILLASYMCNSALMLVANKLAVHMFPASSTLLLLQLGTSFSVMFIGACFGLDVTPCSKEYLKNFWPVALIFLGTIYCGLRAIQYANIETFIIFRAATPIVLSFCDYFFLGRQLPSKRSALCLITMLASSTAYVMTDSFFVIKGYFWIGIWYFVFVTDFVVIKHTVTKVEMTNWGRVLYTNGLALIPLMFAVPILESKMLAEIQLTALTVFVIALSCILGIGMSFLSFKVRSQVTATYFAIIGNVCKVISVIINYLMWDKHATPIGLSFLGLSLVAAYFYEQAPLREDSDFENAEAPEEPADEEELTALV